MNFVQPGLEIADHAGNLPGAGICCEVPENGDFAFSSV